MAAYDVSEYEKKRLMELVFDLHVLTEKDIKKANKIYKYTDHGRFLKDAEGHILKSGDLAVLLSVVDRNLLERKYAKDYWVSRHQVSKWLETSETELKSLKEYSIKSGRKFYGDIEDHDRDIEIMKLVLQQFKIQENNEDINEETYVSMGL